MSILDRLMANAREAAAFLKAIRLESQLVTLCIPLEGQKAAGCYNGITADMFG